mmetsp:Transcript_37581/g.115819  ORF Transcript_37581/g.115819 Transcript_37581/m.115819 type:complete len:227 (+) Transcript_37581:304-984(+)
MARHRSTPPSATRTSQLHLLLQGWQRQSKLLRPHQLPAMLQWCRGLWQDRQLGTVAAVGPTPAGPQTLGRAGPPGGRAGILRRVPMATPEAEVGPVLAGAIGSKATSGNDFQVPPCSGCARRGQLRSWSSAAARRTFLGMERSETLPGPLAQAGRVSTSSPGEMNGCPPVVLSSQTPPSRNSIQPTVGRLLLVASRAHSFCNHRLRCWLVPHAAQELACLTVRSRQ